MRRLIVTATTIIAIATLSVIVMTHRRDDRFVPVRERIPRTPEQQEAWQRHQHSEWEWNKTHDNRDFKRCLLKYGYDKCMGRSY